MLVYICHHLCNDKVKQHIKKNGYISTVWLSNIEKIQIYITNTSLYNQLGNIVKIVPTLRSDKAVKLLH